jgi:WD40 repeat protein
MEIELISELTGLDGSVYSLEKAGDTNRFYSGSNDQLVVEWNLGEMKPVKAVASLPSRSYALKYIDELNILVVGNYSGGMHVIDLNLGKEIRLFQLHQNTIFNIEYDEKRKRIISLSADGSYAVWSLPDFQLLHHEFLTSLKVRCVAFRPDKDEMVIGCGDGTIRVIDTETFEQRIKLEGHEKDYSVNGLAYTPDGKQLISGGRDARLAFWDLANGYELINKIPAHNYAIYSIVFHPSKPIYATGSMDKTIRIWEIGKMRPIRTIDLSNGGHKNSVNKLLWSDFNDYLISTGDDRSIKVWNIEL